MHELSWNDFKLIKAIADAKGMGGAATSLKVNHSTVFRQLGEVERRLGVALFDRHRSGYVLTSTGEEMVALAERMETDIAGFTRKLAGHGLTPSGELRVTTNDVLLIHLLPPLLEGYTQAFPHIRLDVVQTNQALSLSKRDADIAIRATDTPPENLVGRRISGLAWALYGNAGQFRHDAPPPAEQLASMRWVGFGEEMSGSKPARYLAGQVAPERVVLRLNTVLGMAEAVENRIGIGALPCYIGDVRQGLVRLSAPIPQLATGLWLLTHADLRNAIRVRSFMDFMGTALARQKGRLEGNR